MTQLGLFQPVPAAPPAMPEPLAPTAGWRIPCVGCGWHLFNDAGDDVAILVENCPEDGLTTTSYTVVLWRGDRIVARVVADTRKVEEAKACAEREAEARGLFVRSA